MADGSAARDECAGTASRRAYELWDLVNSRTEVVLELVAIVEMYVTSFAIVVSVGIHPVPLEGIVIHEVEDANGTVLVTVGWNH